MEGDRHEPGARSDDDDEYEWLFDPESAPPADRAELPEQPTAELPVTGHRRNWRRRVAITLGAVLVAGAASFAAFDRLHDSGQSPPPAAQSTAPAVTLSPKPQTQAECIAKLPLDFKLAQMMMPSATADTAAAISAVMARYDVGGVIFMGPVPSAVQAKALVAAQKLPPLVATDQEGGTVQRYTQGGTLPAAASVPGLWSVQTAQQKMEASAEYLRSQAVNMDLAPLADVAPTGGSSVLGTRIFSSDANVVAEYAGAYVAGGSQAGVLMTLKHFPGLGDATQNTDYGPATAQSNLQPYKELAGTAAGREAAIMVGNQTVPDLTTGPASLSSAAITGLLRGTLGYKDNVVITDSLSAKAITDKYTITQAAVKAWEAGADIALFVGTDQGLNVEQQIQHILAAAKTAVQNGQLQESQVNAAFGRLAALPQKHIDACRLAPNNG